MNPHYYQMQVFRRPSPLRMPMFIIGYSATTLQTPASIHHISIDLAHPSDLYESPWCLARHRELIVENVR
jgi:hypothetical protein